MFTLMAVDPFATKGIEYVLVLVFLAALPLYWKWLNAGARPALQARTTARQHAASGWFRLPADHYHHPGHAWAQPAGERRWRIGVDDFAQLLLGRVNGVTLPDVGTQLVQGARGWGMRVGSETFDMLAPVNGRVTGRNEQVLHEPGLVNRDPYGSGWLLEIESSDPAPDRKTLLHGELAKAWMGTTENALRGRMDHDLGTVMQDGGTPVIGLARAIAPDQWSAFAREFLLTR